MPNTENSQLPEHIANTGQRVGIPVSEDHANLVAKSSDSLFDAIDAVRAMDYQDHEPCNVFNPVALADASDKRDDQ